jgi:hypothetical protein
MYDFIVEESNLVGPSFQMLRFLPVGLFVLIAQTNAQDDSCKFSITVPRSQLVPVGDCADTNPPLGKLRDELQGLLKEETNRIEDQLETLQKAVQNLAAALSNNANPNCTLPFEGWYPN